MLLLCLTDIVCVRSFTIGTNGSPTSVNGTSAVAELEGVQGVHSNPVQTQIISFSWGI